ncbi:MAG: pyridoxal-dependent decarboxylase [Gemmatimonadaceae bacterium]
MTDEYIPFGETRAPTADSWRTLLTDAAERAIRYRQHVGERPVAPPAEAVGQLATLGGHLPQQGLPAADVLALLDSVAGPATTAMAGGRYFGFVNGSSLPVALAANWLADAWNQNVALHVMSPAGATLEDVVLRWTAEALDLPATSGALVGGASMANLTGLLAARHAVLERAGWNVEADGLFGAPPITVVVGDEVHTAVVRALGFIGLGRDRVVRVPADGQGRLRPDRLPAVSGPVILCVQAGNVNTGAFDPMPAIGAWAKSVGAWTHVDGAFGIWARAEPSRAHLAAGYELADSWATDGHKMLNVPYDCGIALVKDQQAHRAAMAFSAAYLPPSGIFDPMHHSLDGSRRARSFDVWAAYRFLGREGLADLVRSCSDMARLIARRLSDAGLEILNDVDLNQVLVGFADDATTAAVIAAVQQDRTCWCGGTRWHGRDAMRISVSSWATTRDDAERSAQAIIDAAARTRELTRTGAR